MNRIISISGAQGVGKTSIITAIFADGGTVVTPSASNIAASMQFRSPAEKQEFIVSTMESQLNQALAIDAPIYLDRSALDCYSYMALDNSVPADIKAAFEKRLRKMASYINYAFIPKPGEFAIAANGIRSTDADYQQRWHAALITFAKECNVPYKELTGSVQDRVKIIKTTLSKELKL
jgi:predicted ATPase